MNAADGPTTSTPPRSNRRRSEYSRYAARCSATTVLPVPGPPPITVTPRAGARIASSCSAWMVATMSRIVCPRARDSEAISAPSPSTGRSSGDRSGASRSSSSPTIRGALVPQYATPYYAQPVGRRRPVERLGGRCPPVDHQRLVLRVADADPADVQLLQLGRGRDRLGARHRRRSRAGRTPGPRAPRPARRSGGRPRTPARPARTGRSVPRRAPARRSAPDRVGALRPRSGKRTWRPRRPGCRPDRRVPALRPALPVRRCPDRSTWGIDPPGSSLLPGALPDMEHMNDQS